MATESAENLATYRDASKTQSVYLTKSAASKSTYTWHARLDDADLRVEDWVHEDHRLEDSDLVKKPGEGLTLEIVVSVPLRATGESGYQALQVKPSLFTLKGNTSHPETHPVVVRPEFKGGLFMRNGLGSPQEDTLLEVTPGYMQSCTVINPTTRICPRPVLREERGCLTALYQGHSLRQDCLDNFKIVPTTDPVLGDTEPGHVTLFLPAPHSLFAKCGEKRDDTALLETQPGLYSVSLPTNCALTAGPLTWTMLSSPTVFAQVDAVTDAQAVAELVHMEELREEAAWDKWRQYKMEDNAVHKNLLKLK